MSLLEADRSKYLSHLDLPPETVVQELDGQKYGVRSFRDRKELEKVLRPGDIQVNFNPLSNISTPINILEDGMSHVTIMVRNRPLGPSEPHPHKAEMSNAKEQKVFKGTDTFCHIDSPPEMSDCNIGDSHFFRVISVDDAGAERIAEQATQLYLREAFEYNNYFARNLSAMACPAMEQKILDAQEKAGQLQFYCSELPYTLYSILNRQDLLPVTYPTELMHRFAQNISTGHFMFGNRDHLDQYIKDNFGGGHTDNEQNSSIDNAKMRAFVNIVSTIFYDGYTSQLAKKALDYATGGMVMPSGFMSEAKKATPDKKIVYLGSLHDSYEWGLRPVLTTRGDLSNHLRANTGGGVAIFNSSHLEWHANSNGVIRYDPPAHTEIEDVTTVGFNGLIVMERLQRSPFISDIAVKYLRPMGEGFKVEREFNYAHETYVKGDGKLVAHLVDERAYSHACFAISVKSASHYSNIESVCVESNDPAKKYPGIGIAMISPDMEQVVNIVDGTYDEATKRSVSADLY